MIAPPPLKNDCFAMPPGVDWTPVDEALAHLNKIAQCVTETQQLVLADAAGRYLAQGVRAMRSHPPHANSAVDGYGFAHASLGNTSHVLPLVEGRAAAGAPFIGTVPHGQALKVLTGANLPQGVDTVVLEEDITSDANQVAFQAGIKKGANTRAAGEDVEAGAIIAPHGTKLRAQELALLSAVGIQEVSVHAPLRVGVLSTGDELVTEQAGPGQIYDANRPMLLAQVADWGYEPVDLGHVRDNKTELSECLSAGSSQADVILTSGGASAGDEDHVSALLRETGSLGLWRIAVKPGRPLALGMWQGVPVFGLPGNPVAAFVCTLVFAAPVLRVLAGGNWRLPRWVEVPAAFSKSKKAGRREYLRARLSDDGKAEVFKSEGSGRISGLAWADGLVELGDGARQIDPGDMVRYLPFSEF